MPVLGLPLFWLLPINYALPIYAVVVLISALLYWAIRRAMRKPIQDGFQSLIGTQAEVVSRSAPDYPARYLVRSQGELWSAYSADTLQPGEPVNIVALKGIGVVVKRTENSSRSSKVDNAQTAPSGAKDNRQRCH
jgi:membrane protein implicated in regulation of membrane protease activity